jgi:hypothetical protein
VKSKPLQKKSYGAPREVVDGQQENIEGSSLSSRGARSHLIESTQRLKPTPAMAFLVC